MTPEQMRVAIAKAIGWTDIETLVDGFENRRWEFYTNEPNYYPDDSYQIGSIVGRNPNRRGKLSHVPDYPADLNAMHEAEKVLTPEQSIDYAGILRKSCGVTVTGIPSSFPMLHATALQRAEAFCKTLNLKVEDET